MIHSPDSKLFQNFERINHCPGGFLTWLTFFVLVIDNWLYFAAFAVAGPFEDVEGGIQDQMTLLVHIANWPVAQLAIVNDSCMSLLAVAEGKGSARELGAFDALHFTFADRTHSQRVPDNGLKEPCRINRPEKTF